MTANGSIKFSSVPELHFERLLQAAKGHRKPGLPRGGEKRLPQGGPARFGETESLGPFLRHPHVVGPSRCVHAKGKHQVGVLFGGLDLGGQAEGRSEDTRLNSSHVKISYAVFCLKKKKI